MDVFHWIKLVYRLEFKISEEYDENSIRMIHSYCPENDYYMDIRKCTNPIIMSRERDYD